ncbi:conserved hypothetical protein [Candidatus Nitrospira nitrificans]|uniref:DUF4231 domain-containing protein n=2 Tax=Candidatus Nitrospira nitrificans TaxID=1742973 RepID=A0A0S4LN60_9BACT|nr:conserved hypothetical protein [Candidatus Nitrospira nitrificans]
MIISCRLEGSVDVIGFIYDQPIQMLSDNPLGRYFRRFNTKTVGTTWPSLVMNDSVEERMNNMNETTGHEHMRAEMDKLIAALELPELNKEFMRARWLELVIWMDGKAKESVWWYRRLRLATIIGGVIVPALVSLNVGDDVTSLIKTLTFIVSLVVALSAAVEEFFRYGERWRHYRRMTESLKSEGWHFLQLSGVYANHTHIQAYPTFATRVEELSGEEVESYITHVFREKKVGDEKAPSVS